MNNNDRLRVGIPYLLLMAEGCSVIAFIVTGAFSSAMVVGVLAMVVGAIGYLWTTRDPPKKPKTKKDPLIHGRVHVGIPVDPEVVDDVKQFVADGGIITKNWEVP